MVNVSKIDTGVIWESGLSSNQGQQIGITHIATQPALTCSKSVMKTTEQWVKYVQSWR